MKAIICQEYGTFEILQYKDVKEPVPKDDEVLIKVHSAIVSPADCIMRQGKPLIARLFSGLFKPKNMIMGEAFSGVVEGTGKNVESFRKGDTVFGSSGLKLGAYAEYLCVPMKELLVKKPEDLGHDEAVSICDGPITSLPFLRDNGGIQNGQRVLINGASGSVGIAAVQLAKYFGAEVTGVCSSSKIDLVKSIGADEVIDYTKEDFTEADQGYDIIFDAVGLSSFKKCKRLLSRNGIYLTTIPTISEMIYMLFVSRKKGKRGQFAATGLRSSEDKKKDIDILLDIIKAGKLKLVIDKVYPLEKLSEAQEYVEGGHKKGSVVVHP